MKAVPARIPIGAEVRVYIDDLNLPNHSYTEARDKGYGTVVGYYPVGMDEFGHTVKLTKGYNDNFYYKFVHRLTKLEQALK